MLLWCSPCGWIYREHGKGQVKDRLAPTQPRSVSFRSAGQVCHFHHSFSIINTENIRTAIESTKTIQTHQKAISWSLLAFKGSSLQNSECQITLPMKSCSQAVPSGGLTERDSTQISIILRRAGVGLSFYQCACQNIQAL